MDIGFYARRRPLGGPSGGRQEPLGKRTGGLCLTPRSRWPQRGWWIPM